jgi:hypothetical protein
MAISMLLFSGSPRKELAPVMEKTPPILYGSLLQQTEGTSPSNTAAQSATIAIILDPVLLMAFSCELL